MGGVYTTAPGLMRNTDGVFDKDETYQRYIENKKACEAEDISKYYCRHDFKAETEKAVMQLLPAADTFHDACMQLQEDVAVIQMEGDRDWLAAIHLCSPNHWDPRTKIGRPFNEIHLPVPHIERTVKNYQVMLKMIIEKEPFMRFAWGIATDDRLNHHPETPKGINADEWRGRRMADSNTEFFVRTERQSLIGLKAVNAFIFTIRTYFYKVSELNGDEKRALAAAVQSMSNESLEYKGMLLLKDALLRQL